VAQSHMEDPSDENGHELRSGGLNYLQDFPAGFPNVVEWDRIVRNAQGLGGGVDEVSNVEVIEVPDGLLAETPNCQKSLDHSSEGLGTGQVKIVERFFAGELDVVTENDPIGARELPGLLPLPVHRGQRLRRPAQ